MTEKQENTAQTNIKEDLSMVSSYCHSLITSDDESLEHMVAVLKNHFEIYRKKHRLSYADCCNSFNTEYSQKKDGYHKGRRLLNVNYLLNLESLTRIELSNFIKSSGWTDQKGKVVYPGWNLACLDYSLGKRHGIDEIKDYLCQQEERKGPICEEETLKKRGLTEQENSEVIKDNRTEKKESLITPMKNKYFNKGQYHNLEYEKMRRGIRSENKQVMNTTRNTKKETDHHQ